MRALIILIVILLAILFFSCQTTSGGGDLVGPIFKNLTELLSNERFLNAVLATYDTYKASKKLEDADRVLVLMIAISPALKELNAALDKAKLESLRKEVKAGNIPPDFDPLTQEAIQKLKSEKQLADVTGLLKKVRAEYAAAHTAVAFFSELNLEEIKPTFELAREHSDLERELRGLIEQLTNWNAMDAELTKDSVQVALKVLSALDERSRDIFPQDEEALTIEQALLDNLRGLLKRKVNITLQPWRGDEG
ncbi:MAG: hypothetical protein HY559_07005 [Gammaproteobacteria bacterium]|nr:hypothetical protein [Gammaproteobacteria bacterium]